LEVSRSLSDDTAEVQRRRRRERAGLGLALLLAGVVILLARLQAHRDIERTESARLAAQASAIEQNLLPQLNSAYAALRYVRRQVAQGADEPLSRRTQVVVPLLQGMNDAMAAVDRVEWLDADGRVLASSGAGRAGQVVAPAAGFWRVQARPDAGVLYLAPPFQVAPDLYAMQLSLALFDERGKFSGAISASLDPAYLHGLLESVLYAGDMWAALGHGSGVLAVQSPEIPGLQGAALNQPGSFFSRHLRSGQAATVLTGHVLTTDDDRMMAQRTVKPHGLPLDQAFTIAVSRQIDALYAPWREASELYALVFGLTALASAVSLLVLQSRRDGLERLRADGRRQQAEASERVALALRGADLGLWDIVLPGGRAVVDERWFSMLGLPPAALDIDTSAWIGLVHPDDRERTLAAQQAHIEGRTASFEATYRIRHAQGRWVWILARGRVTERDDQGQARRMAGTHLDITPSMEAQTALRRSEQSLAITLHSIGDAVVATDAQGLVVRMNATAERLLGWRLAEVQGRPLGEIFRIFRTRTREPAPDPVAEVLERGEIVGLARDTLLVARDGTEIQIADSAAPIRDTDGAVHGVVLVFSDVTERWRIEQALREDRARTQGLLDALRSGVVQHAPDLRVLDANPAACRMLGQRLASVLANEAPDPPWHLIDEDELPLPLARYPAMQVQASRQPISNFLAGIVRPGLAEPLWVLWAGLPILADDGSLRLIVVTLVDISERRAAQKAQQLSEARLRMASRLARLGGWRFEAGSQSLQLSPEAAALLERDSTPLPGCTPDVDFVVPAQRAHWQARLARAASEGEPFEDELDAVSGRGRALRLSVQGEAERDGQGRLQAVRGTLQDISEWHQAQQQLRLLEAAVAHLRDVVLVTEADLLQEPGPRIVFVNRAFERLTGYARHEVLGRSPRFLCGPQTDGAELARVDALMQQGQAVRSELVNYDRNGRPFWIELEMAPLTDAQGRCTHFVTVGRDIGERKQAENERRLLERQLRESQKIESLGTLAGGIAHDFNNVLAAILGNVALAREELPSAHRVQTSLDQINRAGLRARSLVQQILMFSRRQVEPLFAQPLAPVVQESLALMRALLPATVRLDTVLAAEPLIVEADSTQLQQVLMNLCTNAWHALPDGRGHIEVGFEAWPDAAAAPSHLGALPAGPCLHLWVSDNGVGMDEATLERVFDPFFTTKPVGQGTGLGLSVAHGIVRSHRGGIWADSEPGAGSTFHVLLPRVVQQVPAIGLDEGALDLALPGGGQRVLYVDDDEFMVEVVQRLLERSGFRVTACADAAQALALVSADPARFDLLVSDFNMPEMSGLELAAEVARLRPGLPIVLSSGYVTDELRQRAAALGVRALLKKENTVEELRGLLLRVLATRP
jgi:PAS domain S-box-containing protein